MSNQLRIIISGGGTGGHIFPAIAIANAIKRMQPSAEILFVGAEGRMEMIKVPQAGYRIEALPITGLQRSLSLKNLMLPVRLVNSMSKASSIVKKFKPDAVVGVGGYASGPVLFLSSLRGIPSVIQEQNSYAGITNKILGKRADKICVAYEGMEKFFPKGKIVLTGNPVRKDISNLEIKRDEALMFFNLRKEQKVLLVIGGSLGAGTINESIRMNLDKIAKENVQLIWQTGKNYFSQNMEAAKQYEETIKVKEFIDRMDLAYAAADAVISRAGALSIAELCIAKKPALLVPSPNVAEDHQTKNAMQLVSRSAALIIPDAEAKERLVDVALQLLRDEPMQRILKENIGRLAKENADEAIAEQVLSLIEKSRNRKLHKNNF